MIAIYFFKSNECLRFFQPQKSICICLVMEVWARKCATFIIIILMIMYLTAKKIKIKKSAYIFKGNTLIVSTGHIFNREEEVRRVLYSPGMSISVHQTFKGKFFNYGDLIISLGYGDAGEIYMRGVKNPLKRKKELLVLMRKNCSVVPQHGYTMNPYSMMYNYMDAYSTMNTPKA